MEVPCPTCKNTILIPEIGTPAAVGISRTTEFKPEASVLSCQSCGGQLELLSGDNIAICRFCGSKSVIRQPTDQLEKLRDAESSGLRVIYYTPSLLVNDSPEYIVKAIQSEPSGCRSPESLTMLAEGIYLPVWNINVKVDCSWRGEYSTTHSVIKVRTVTKQTSGGKSYDVQEQYNATETVWHPSSGNYSFDTGLLLPAVGSFSISQMQVVLEGVIAQNERSGHPISSEQFAVARPTKSQRAAWNDFDCDERINIRAHSECQALIERLHGVNAVVASKCYSLIYCPVAVVSYTANSSDYRHLVNLNTGEFSGDLPLDHDSVANEARTARKNESIVKGTRAFINLLFLTYVGCSLILSWQLTSAQNVGVSISDNISKWVTYNLYGFINIATSNTPAHPWWIVLLLSWIGWLIVWVILLFFKPNKSPWNQFLVHRRAYLCRLVINPPACLAAFQWNQELVTVLRKLADDGQLEDYNDIGVVSQIGNILIDNSSMVGSADNSKEPMSVWKRTAIVLFVFVIAGRVAALFIHHSQPSPSPIVTPTSSQPTPASTQSSTPDVSASSPATANTSTSELDRLKQITSDHLTEPNKNLDADQLKFVLRCAKGAASKELNLPTGTRFQTERIIYSNYPWYQVVVVVKAQNGQIDKYLCTLEINDTHTLYRLSEKRGVEPFRDETSKDLSGFAKGIRDDLKIDKE